MKKRNKKYNPQAAKQNQIALALQGALGRMYLWGSSSSKMNIFGTAQMRVMLPTTSIGRAHVALFDLLQLPTTWHLWVMFVADIGHGRVDIGDVIVTMEESMLSDFTEHLEHTIRGVYKGDGVLTAYAYMAAPNDTVDLAASAEGLMDYWLDKGLAEDTVPIGTNTLSCMDFAHALTEECVSIPTKKMVASNRAPALVN